MNDALKQVMEVLTPEQKEKLEQKIGSGKEEQEGRKEGLDIR